MASALTVLFLGCWLAGRSGVSGHFWPSPSISVSPRGVIDPGEAVTICCRCWCWRLFLYKDGNQIQELNVDGGEGEFTIPSARREDGGVYSCQSHYAWMLFSWWEASDSVKITVAESYYPKPSISLSPSGRVGLGGAVTVRCQAPQRNRRFLLYKAGKPTAVQSVEPAGDLAQFPIRNVGREDAGNYSCYYRTKWDPPVWSEPSGSVELVVAALSYPKPNISLWPSGRIVPGGAVTVRCACRYPGMRFLLYKPGDGAVRRWAEPAEDLAEFPIRNASRRDAGRYSCQYCTKSDPPVWSEPSDPMELVVAEGNDPAGPQQPDPPPTEMEGKGGTDRTQPGAAPAPTRPGRTGPGIAIDPALETAAPPERPDFTYTNIARLGLGAGVLLILGLILAEACHSRPRGDALGAWIRLGGEENMPGARAAAPWGAETPAQTPASENPPPSRSRSDGFTPGSNPRLQSPWAPARGAAPVRGTSGSARSNPWRAPGSHSLAPPGRSLPGAVRGEQGRSRAWHGEGAACVFGGPGTQKLTPSQPDSQPLPLCPLPSLRAGPLDFHSYGHPTHLPPAPSQPAPAWGTLRR